MSHNAKSKPTGGDDSARASHTPRPRHQVSRSITESAPIKHHRHQLSLHHRRHKSDREEAPTRSLESSLYMQLPQPTFRGLPRSEGTTPYMINADQSRGPGMPTSATEDDGVKLATAAAAGSASLVKDKQLQDEREQAMSRIAGLSKSLVDLTASSNATTRRLDETYFSVLGKLGTLQNTIVALRDLAIMSQEMKDSFKVESQGLITAVEAQVDGFGHFDEQQQRLATLQRRIVTGRRKVQRLSQRVDVVRERVGGWEKADLAWQAKTRKRLRVVWIIMSMLILLVVLLLVGTQYVPAFTDRAADVAPGSVYRGRGRPADEDFARHKRVSSQMSEEVKAALNRTRGDTDGADDEILRAFDEL